MNQISERCTSLMAKFTRLDSVNKDTAQTAQIEAIEVKAIDLASKSGEVCHHFTTLMDGGLCDDIKWNLTTKLGELNDRLEKTIKKVRETPEKVKDDQVWATCERLAHDTTRELNSALKNLWENFINGKTQDRVGTLSAFRGLAQCHDAIVALEGKERQAAGRRNQLPESPEDIAFILDIDESMTALISGIGIQDEPDEMIEFLKRCASGTGVPFSELTDERLKWLRVKNFGESLKLRG